MGKFEAREEDIAATDYRAYFDSSCLRVWHLAGKDRTYRIARVTRLTSEMVSGNKREVKKQPKLELVDGKGNQLPLPLLLNKTNATTIAGLYGNNPSKWVGQLITLFPSTTSVGGQDRDCIRVRNERPKARGQQQAPAPAPVEEPEREPGVDDDEPPYGALEGEQ